MTRVAVIGGGPAGMLAASAAARNGHDITLFEKNEKTGKKLYITGKGRCNLTNIADHDEFMLNIPRNPKFLYSALYNFFNTDIIGLVESMGVPTKVERGGRVFPASDKSSDVCRALERYLRDSGARLVLGAEVKSVSHENGGFTLDVGGKQERFDALVIACGGASYPLTGSTGDGYKFAKALGHTVTPIKPSLTALETNEAWCRDLMGVSLKNVTLTAYKNGREVFSELGEMLFTHFGVSGPLVLSASSRIADAPEGAELSIDLKPGLSHEALERRIMRDLEKNNRKQFANSLSELLIARLVPVIIELSRIPPETPASSVTKEQRRALVEILKNLRCTVARACPIEEAIITRGGVSTKEINASTMESKLVGNLYFAGEVIDVDGYTGGFNLQIAYSTGVLAGSSIK